MHSFLTPRILPTPQLHVAAQVLFELSLSEAAQPGELLSIHDDGSGSSLQGTFPVAAVHADSIDLSIRGGIVSFRYWELHYPFNPTLWSERQHQVVEQLIAKLQITFILGTASGFMGCQGFPQYPEQAARLSMLYPGKIVWRASATEAAEDLQAIGMGQTKFEIVVWMNSQVILAGMPACHPRWRATGEMLHTHIAEPF